MRRRHVVVFALVLLLALTICQVSAWSAHTKLKHIPGFHVVEHKQLAKSMVAGSTYEWEVSFVNPKSESGFMNVTLEITEEKTDIGPGEFSVEGTLESYDNPPHKHYSTLTFAEEPDEGGIFKSESEVKEKFNHVILTISSVPNLMPDTYTFTLTVTLQY